jgi:hypothetical protein
MTKQDFAISEFYFVTFVCKNALKRPKSLILTAI